MNENEQAKCAVSECKEPPTEKFFGKQLCSYHYELSQH